MKDILDDELLPEKEIKFFKLSVLLYWTLFLIVGLIFRVLHWPGASPIILITTGGITGYSLSGLLSKGSKNIINIIVCVISMLWFLFILGTLIIDKGLYSETGVAVYGIAALLSFAIYEIVRRRRVHTGRAS
jgi:hypothetical protein